MVLGRDRDLGKAFRAAFSIRLWRGMWGWIGLVLSVFTKTLDRNDLTPGLYSTSLHVVDVPTSKITHHISQYTSAVSA